MKFALIILMLNLTNPAGQQIGYSSPVMLFADKPACDARRVEIMKLLEDPMTVHAFGGPGVSWIGAVCIPTIDGGAVDPDLKKPAPKGPPLRVDENRPHNLENDNPNNRPRATPL